MTNRKLLRLATTLLFAGVLLTFFAGILHPANAPANNHVASFAEYAGSSTWAAVHLGQFAGMAVIVVALLVLLTALDFLSGTTLWAGRLVAALAAGALALYAVLQAVDGVALKQAVDAWAGAPDAEKAARFASAEAIRWLEWGMRSYQSYVFGLTLVAFGAVIGWTGRAPRPIGYLMALAGLAYLAQGWVLGTEGFSATNTVPTISGHVFIIATSLWLLVNAWRMREGIRAS